MINILVAMFWFSFVNGIFVYVLHVHIHVETTGNVYLKCRYILLLLHCLLQLHQCFYN